MVSDMVRFKNVLLVAERKGLPEEVKQIIKELGPDLMADKQKRKRQPRLPAPNGGISMCSAEKKYHISHVTILRWVRSKYIPVMQKTDYETFINESRVAKLAEAYYSDPGRGSWAVKKFILKENEL